MRRRCLYTLLVGLAVACLSVPGHATVDWNILRTFNIDSAPRDVAIAMNGQMLYVLTESGHILVLDGSGKVKDKIHVGQEIDHIKAGPREDLLIISSQQNKTVQIVSINLIHDINISGSPYKGPSEAPVVIAVFSDFQWAYCARLVPVLEQVLEMYPNEVKLVFKNYPLRNHQFAMKAAQAALAADGQGKFWEFHDLLFQSYDRLTDAKIQEITTALSLNQEAFDQTMKAPQTIGQIRSDLNDGAKSGVRGTPTIFINGKRLMDRSLEGFRAVIEKELKGSAASSP